MEQGWALQPAVVNESINLGTTNAQRIDQAPKVRSCDVIMTPSVQPAVVNFLWSAQTYSINFVNSFIFFQNRSGNYFTEVQKIVSSC